MPARDCMTILWRHYNRQAAPRVRLRAKGSGYACLRVPLGNVDGLVDRPTALPARLGTRFRQQRIELGPRHQGEAEPAQMAALALTIVQHETPFLQVTAERDEANF